MRRLKMLMVCCLLAMPETAAALGQLRSMAPTGGQNSRTATLAMSSTCGDVIAGVSTAGSIQHWAGFYGPLPRMVSGVDDPPKVVPDFYLSRPQPNPSRNGSLIEFRIPHESPASLEIFDVLGRPVRQWRWPKLSAGPHQVLWNGRTNAGRTIPPGVLFYRLLVNGQTLEQKLIHLQ